MIHCFVFFTYCLTPKKKFSLHMLLSLKNILTRFSFRPNWPISLNISSAESHHSSWGSDPLSLLSDPTRQCRWILRSYCASAGVGKQTCGPCQLIAMTSTWCSLKLLSAVPKGSPGESTGNMSIKEEHWRQALLFFYIRYQKWCSCCCFLAHVWRWKLALSLDRSSIMHMISLNQSYEQVVSPVLGNGRQEGRVGLCVCV